MGDATENAEIQGFLAAARGGDKEALEALLSRFVQPIYRFGMKMCRHPEDAKEVLQDTLLAAARTVGDFRGDASVSTWLYTIARSFCIKRRRRGKHAPTAMVSLEHAAEEAPHHHHLVDPARAPDEAAAGTELARALAGAVDSLEPAYREVLVLRDVEGLTAPEVAEVLGLGVEAVKSRLHRARVALRARLAPVLEGGPAHPAAGCGDIVTMFSKQLEGDIDAPACAEMERHLAGCPQCAAACESLRRTLALCRSAGPEVPEAVQDEVRAALNKFLRLPVPPGPSVRLPKRVSP